MFQAGLLQGQTIAITGGGTGLGAAMATRFAGLGAEVALLGRRKEKLEETAHAIMSAGGKASVHQCDVRDFSSVETVAKSLPKVDGLINNAAGNFLAASEDLSSNAFKTVIDIVLNGTFHCTSAFGRRMIESGKGGAMVNIVTSYAWTGSAFVLPSACAKAGVLALTRSLAVEWAHYKIRVNAIAPGPVPTDGAFSRLLPDPSLEEMARNRVPLKRFGTPQEIADAATYLMSPGAGYVTGDCIAIDGGEWLRNGGEFSWGTDYDRENLKAMLKAMRGKEK
jgi:NAD(P)-dependent dehydrogenase (short-subunit alcohol dehydrogenase family)